MNWNRFVAIGGAFLLPVLVWLGIASYAADTRAAFEGCLGISALGGVILALLAAQWIVHGKLSVPGIIAAIVLNLVLPWISIVFFDEDPAPPPPGVPGLVPFTAAEPALPEWDEEELTGMITDGLHITGWRLLPVIQHRYPPHQSRKTVFETEFDPRKGKTVMTDLDLTLLDNSDLWIERTTQTTWTQDVMYRGFSSEDPRSLHNTGSREHFTVFGDTSLYLSPGVNAHRNDYPAVVKVEIEPPENLRAIWVKTEKDLPPSNDPVPWGALPARTPERRPLQKVTLLVQAFEPGGEGKPLSANFLQQLPMAERPRVALIQQGAPPLQDAAPLRSDGSYRLEYAPEQWTDEWPVVWITPSTGNVTCTWRVCVRIDWYTTDE